MAFPFKYKLYSKKSNKLNCYKVFYVILSVSLLLFLGIAMLSKVNLSPLSIKKWTVKLPSETFVTILSMEIPQFDTLIKSSSIEKPNYSKILFEMVTSFNPTDPRSLIRNEIPGFSFFDGELIVAGQGVNYTDIPTESAPPLEVIIAEREATDPLSNSLKNTIPEYNTELNMTTQGRKVVFIYHSHNRESWLPYLKSESDPDRAYHPDINITKVGLRLGEELEKRGIGTLVDTTDVTGQLLENGWSYNQSYQASKPVAETALSQNNDITFIFDIHRDSFRRKRTTVEINGQAYARTFFIIGSRNNDYEQNLAFAEQFHEMIEKSYPGLSRGVAVKNATYNQSLSQNKLLIEIGGVDNTLEESYRTVEALAEVIADLYWNAEKVHAKPNDQEL